MLFNLKREDVVKFMTKNTKKKRYLFTKIILSLAVALPMVMGTSSTPFIAKAAGGRFDELVRNETFNFVVGETGPIFSVLKDKIGDLAHLDNGYCFTNLVLEYVDDSSNYYTINADNSITGMHGGETKIRIKGNAQCGGNNVYETGIDSILKITVLPGEQRNAPVIGTDVKAVNAIKHGENGALVDVLNSGKLEYTYKGFDKYRSLSGIVSEPRGEYLVRFAGNADYKAGPSVNLTIMEPNETPVNAPVFDSKTDTTITVKAEPGLTYSVDGINWFADGVVKGLTPNTEYTVMSKRLGDPAQYYLDSEHGPATGTIKTKLSSAQVGLPVKPVVTGKSDTVINYNTVEKQEYSLDQKTWIDGDGFANLYSNLTPNTEYKIYTRIKETPDAMPSVILSTDVKTKKDINSVAVPAEPKVTNRTDTTITIDVVPGQEYKIGDGDWQVPVNGVFTGLEPNTPYVISTRTPETSDAVASKVVSTNAKTKASSSSVMKPDAPVVSSKSDVSLTVDVVAGNQYRIGNTGAWITPKEGAATYTFAGLNQNKDYTIETRVAETTDAMPSEIVSTNDKTKIGSAFVTKPNPATIIAKSDKTMTVDVIAGQQYAISGPGIANAGTWYTPGVDGFMGTFGGLTADSEYTIKTRTVETADAMASLPVDTKDRTKVASANVQKPSAPVILNTTDSTLTIAMNDGIEYSIDGKNWVSSKTSFDGKFTELDENTEITVWARKAETATAMESSPVTSKAKTLCKIAGTVISNDLPATIAILNKTTGEVIKTIETHKDGTYSAILPAGDYDVVITGKNGKESLMGKMTAPAKGAVDYTLKAGAMLSGNVVNGAKENVPNIKVSLYDVNGDVIATTTSNKLGKYYFDGIKDGEYKMVGAGLDAKNNAVSGMKAIVVKDGKVADADLHVMNGYLLSGGAVTNKGVAIPNAKVNVLDKDGKIIASTNTDAKGNYYMTSVAGGKTIEFTDPISTATRVENYVYIVSNPNDGTAVMKPAAIDMSKEIAREEFIKTNLTKDNKVITERTADNYAQILNAEANWNALSADEKTAINKLLTGKYAGKTYEVLLADSKALATATNAFIKDHLTDVKGVIKTADESNYTKIIGSEATWNKLSAMEKAAINNTLLANGGKTYEELLRDAKAIDAAAKAFIANNASLNNAIIKGATNHKNIRQILASEATWNNLSATEKAVVNANLVKEGGKTFDELLKEAKAIDESTNSFVDNNIKNLDSIIKDINNGNYKQILNSEADWNNLSDAEKDFVNSKLLAAGSKTFEELLKDAKNTKVKVDEAGVIASTGDATDMAGVMLMMGAAGACMLVMKKRRNRDAK